MYFFFAFSDGISISGEHKTYTDHMPFIKIIFKESVLAWKPVLFYTFLKFHIFYYQICFIVRSWLITNSNVFAITIQIIQIPTKINLFEL